MSDEPQVVYCDDYEAIVGPKPTDVKQVTAKVVKVAQDDEPETTEAETK